MLKTILGMTVLSFVAYAQGYPCTKDGLRSYTNTVVSITLEAGKELAIATEQMSYDSYDRAMERLEKNLKLQKKKMLSCFK
ncbi:MAG: hypothetical protein N4A33_00210 [Bacteriovoracaceae bacterium]|jgi:ribosome-associated translation inhibitor RaiA|nr:hypothetical protein [Bacteriovoracaceae bacterium]